MKRLLVCIAFALCAASLITAPANAADRGQPLLDNVPIEATQQLANDIDQSVVALYETNSNGIDPQMAMDVATLGAVGQQSALSYTALNMVMTRTGSEARGSSMAGTRRVGDLGMFLFKVASTYPALRPDPHNGVGSQHTLA